MDTLLLGLALLDSVLLDTVEELLSGSGVVDVLDADVHSLLDVSVADALVDYDTNGGLGDVVYDAGLSVEVFVWHTRKRKRFSKPGAVIKLSASISRSLDLSPLLIFYFPCSSHSLGPENRIIEANGFGSTQVELMVN